MTVTFAGITITCDTAYRELVGINTYNVELLDSSGNVIAEFDGVTDLNAFTLAGGSWSTHPTTTDCRLMVRRSSDKKSVACSVYVNSLLRSGSAFDGTMVFDTTNDDLIGDDFPEDPSDGQVFFKLAE